MKNIEALTQDEIANINGGSQTSYDKGYVIGEAIGKTLSWFSIIRAFI